ncbi:MAG: esterase-like activity of phytase family protein [Mycolicibacter sinensis]
MRSKLARLPLLALLLVAGCAPCQAPAVPALEYLGQLQLPPNSTFAGTTVGGLSGISYDPGRDCYYVISDDRSASGPARFYTVRLSVSERGVDEATITAVHPLLDESGRAFGPLDLDHSPPVVPPDPEGIAFDSGRQRLYWSSEGERLTGAPPGPTPLADPWVRIAGLDGGYLGRFAIPPQLAMSAQHTGPRRNTTLEGLTVTADGRLLFAAMEGPGYADGALPDQAGGALTRITAYRLDADGKPRVPVAQYAYPLEPATAPAETNGLTDLVALSDTAFLVIERAFSTRPTVRLYRAEIAGATDVLRVPALAGHPVTPMTKTLLADLSATPGLDPLDNIEGITLGPRLPDGRQAVVLVSDDNFSPRQVTQFVVFAMAAR